MSSKDAWLSANEMRCKPDFFERMKKAKINDGSTFAGYIRNVMDTTRATFPFFQLQRHPKRSDHEALRQHNREQSCSKVELEEPELFEPQPNEPL